MIEKVLPVEADLTLFRTQLPTKRRQSRRQRCALATMAKLRLAEAAEVLVTWVSNLSLGGVGLNSPQSLEVGQEIVINFRVSGQNIPPQPARVVFSQAQADESWRIGCEFLAPISPDIVDAILS